MAVLAIAGAGCDVGARSAGAPVFLSSPAQVAPAPEMAGLERSPALRWEDPLPLHAGPFRFELQIARDAAFEDIVESAADVRATEHRPQGLAPGERYHWRVRARGAGATSPWSATRAFETAPAAGPTTVPDRQVIYQLVVRHFGNVTGSNAFDGDIATNGVGRFADIDEVAIGRLRDMGVTHIWLTGVLRQATLTDWSAYGMPPDDPDILKGRAGSFYAIRDYYDVCPDYAVDPARRLEEFQALLGRIQAAGLKALIDIVPNHVARSYSGDRRPAGEPDLGEGDDQSAFFRRDNNFFYLQADPGRPLELQAPQHWGWPGMDGRFAREDGTPGNTARVTGDNQATYTPPQTSWYETVKLNYGYDFTTGQADFGAPGDRPDTWLRMRRILQYWVDLGVDGFRCDFAHFVPDAAWAWLIDETRAHAASLGREVLFVAEAYENLQGLLDAGFDAVYEDHTYDAVKAVYQESESVGALEAHLRGFDYAAQRGWVRYLENHDERRIASPLVKSGSPGGTGLGHKSAGRHVAPLVYLAGPGPILFYNGQEVGEDGSGAAGFSGDDGRTSIFDYWRLPALSGWVNGHRFDGGGLSPAQRELRAYYRRLLAIADHPYVRGDGYWGLNYVNGWPDDAVIFARYASSGGGLLLVVTNFALEAYQASIRLPSELGEPGHAALPADLRVRRVLGPFGDDTPLVEETTRAALEGAGFPLHLPAGASAVYLID